ncbi:MAG: phosphoglucosamine mutase [Armatimonadota bacterium]
MSLFGTDGIRGVANEELTPELAVSVGVATGLHFRRQDAKTAAIGRDTRRSGSMLSAAVLASLCSAGIDVTDLGIAPTPAVSWFVRTRHADFGIVISASHNPPADNGIKLLSKEGTKLEAEEEEEIEQGLGTKSPVAPQEVGRAFPQPEALEGYIDWLASLFPGRLDGMRVALDAANGAAYAVAPRLLRRLGAEVTAIGVDGDGDYINDGVGATCPKTIQRLTVQSGAAIGISLDGDADRCIFSDEKGSLINGDRTMAIIAHALKLEPKVVVGTVMSNLAFEEALEENGYTLERTAVGDRNVAERMKALGAKIGGEQSGHIILSDYAPTGDGLLTAVIMLRVLKESGLPASQLPPVYENRPQVLINARVEKKDGWRQSDRIRKAIAHGDEEVRGIGRVLVRPSGTQPVIRIMVEATDQALRDKVAEDILTAVLQELGGEVADRVELTDALGD